MTKVGEGDMHPQSSQEVYHKQLQENISRFENALGSYQIASDNQEIIQLRSLMEQQMDLIRVNIREIKRLGIHKQGEIVEHDFQRYNTNPTKENFTALQQDLSTLKEYNFKP